MTQRATDTVALKERLLQEAQAAIAEHGFFGVSARQLALAAGVHPSMVGSLFGSRTALLKAAEDRLRRGAAEA